MGGKGVSCYLLDPVEDGALHLPSQACAAAAAAREARGARTMSREGAS